MRAGVCGVRKRPRSEEYHQSGHGLQGPTLSVSVPQPAAGHSGPGCGVGTLSFHPSQCSPSYIAVICQPTHRSAHNLDVGKGVRDTTTSYLPGHLRDVTLCDDRLSPLYTLALPYPDPHPIILLYPPSSILL